MNELIDIQPDINVRESEYKRLLGYPSDYELEDRARELADWARQWFNENGKPWIYAVRLNKLDTSKENLSIWNIELSSKKLRNQFAEAETDSAILAVVSAGKECEEKAHQLWIEGKPDEYFFLEVYGSAVVEHLVATTGFRFCDWAEKNSMMVLPHYSPGYPGWKVEDQEKILELIKQNKTQDLPGEIYLFESGMLKPKKSMLAIFGITKNVNKVRSLKELIPCESCSLANCQYRRVPYKNPRRQIEDIRRLQSDNKSSNGKDVNESILTHNAKYSVSQKALQKWSDERLQLNVLNDNSIEAKFRYEGTTCSNMGRKLEFNYQIKLSPQDEGYKITKLGCKPLDNDDGYKFMCEYLRNPEGLMNNIENEKPLFGKPLNDILSWERQFSPDGCYCRSESRNHKWGLAFEVLHYTLANRHPELVSGSSEKRK
jgi:hypothetical protein